jgi:hypothetical protein
MLLKYYGIICLFLMLLIIIVYPLAKFKYKGNCGCKEPFHNKKTGLTYSDNIPDYTYLLKDYYPTDNRIIVDSDTYSHNWIYYPIFSLGSYEQITNNLKYFKNPDEGTCTPAEFCGDFYKDRSYFPNTNVSHPLPPVPDQDGIRVNYYRTEPNLFLSDQPGPLSELPAFQ